MRKVFDFVSILRGKYLAVIENSKTFVFKITKLKRRATYEELLQIIEELRAEIVILRKENAQLKEKLAYYENPKNSSNSHIPPSKDENRAKKNQSLRTKSDKKVGGQPGHEGKTLEMKETPDEINRHVPDYCEHCGEDLSGIKEELIERRQVADIVVMPVYTEHQVYGKKCRCGKITEGHFPATVKSPVQYGADTEAMISYLHSRQYMSFKRIEEFFRDVFRLPVSEGGIHHLLNRFTEKAIPIYNEIKSRIEASDFVGTDETGAKVDGKKHWFWAWQNDHLTYIWHSLNRGIATIKDVFINGLPLAILEHDRWNSHFHCQAKGHQLCTAHLLRDFNYIIELYKDTWAPKMKSLLMKAIELKKVLLQEEYYKQNQKIQQLELELDKLLNYTLDPFHKKAIALQKNLLKHRGSILLFLYHPKVPPDNNGSERSIRNVKVKQKVSGQFKSNRGAEIYAINRSIIDTMIKSNQNILAGLKLIANFTSD
jgi:transposase